MNSVFKYGLTAFAADILEQAFLVTFRVTHLSEDVAVWAQQALYVVVRTVGIIQVAEGHLTAGEKFFRLFIAHYQFTLAVAEGYAVDVSQMHSGEPGRRH